ncbi:Serpin-z1c [Thalictrum thalictroides]|uniref:Serpin-z1c n=1 Tax=Thalictrum thalictroides TaxID=46969 RepID=A0A7J6X436_THATH|nr:Serpin-z1c [Thalictrum thalictroides]
MTEGNSSESDGAKTKSKRPMSSTNAPFSCIRIVKDLSKEAKENNFVYSPCSIQLAMSLVANGSNGSTLSELLTFLEAKDLNHLNSVAEDLVNTLTESSEEGQQILTFVGGVWIDESLHLNPTFKSIAESIYKGQAEAVDFENKAAEVVNELNRWAEGATNGLIKSVLPQGSLDETSRLVLANALYFKGKWTEEFLKRNELRTFYLLNGNSVKVPFMTNTKNQYIEIFDDFKVLRLPYKRNSDEKAVLSMYVILPDKRDGLQPLLEKVGDDPLFLEKHVYPGTRAAIMRDFLVSKFEITHEIEASNILQNIGLKLPFSDRAEFAEMLQKSQHAIRLQVSTVHHKSRIEVNEIGTEAAACTLATMRKCCAVVKMPFHVDFVADHPFLFIIRDDISGMVLFMGNVVNPLLK